MKTRRHEISDRTIEHVEILAKLHLSDDERRRAKRDMSAMLAYMDRLQELDTAGVEPMSHIFPISNVFREDTVENGEGSAEMLRNAPEQREGGFAVPKTIV
ncbi:MAG: Asp-tRNA(Asn)/Glu-tRNA(Gln) amidotransferase subunit GatC [Roseburia sp.]